MPRFLLSSSLLILATAASLPGAEAATAAASAETLRQLTFSGEQAVLDALDRDLAAAGADASRLAEIEQRLLAVLRGADSTYAGRQAAAQRLGPLLAVGAAKLNADALKPLPSMLADDRESDLARTALEPVPGDVVDQVFLAALRQTGGRTRLGLLDSIARRRAGAAVPELAKLAQDPDPATAAAALRALGAIGDAAAIAALQAAGESRGVIAALLDAAARLPATEALPLLRDLQTRARDPLHRAAAFRLALELEPAQAASRLTDVLGGQDEALKIAALDVLGTSPAPGLVPAVSRKLPEWDAPTQVAALTALARRAEAGATSVLLKSAESADAGVRTAALTGLGFVPGTRDTTAFLARIAAADDAASAKAARQSLARLNGPDVSATILAGAEKGEAALRVVYLEQLALRHMTESLPLLLKSRADPDVTIRTAAVGALGDLAPVSEQKALLDWTIEASDPAEQSRALRSFVNVALREPKPEDRGRPLFALIETAQAPLALRLLPALGRIGGAASAQTAARLAGRNDAALAEAATTALSRWTDDTALPALVTVAEQAALPSSRSAALDAMLRHFERHRAPWSPESTTLVARLSASTTDVETRRKLVALLHRATDQKALALLETLKGDTALADDVATAADVVRANLAGPPKLRASSSSGLANILDGKTNTRWSVPALGAEWVEVDFHRNRPIRRVTLDQTGRAAEFPEHYEVFVTDDPQQPGKAVTSGTGQRNRTVIDLPAGTRGRYLIVKNTAERKDTPWAICELWVE